MFPDVNYFPISDFSTADRHCRDISHGKPYTKTYDLEPDADNGCNDA